MESLAKQQEKLTHMPENQTQTFEKFVQFAQENVKTNPLIKSP